MITVPALNVGIPVELPKTKAAELNDSKATPIIISINKEGKIFIEEAEINIEDLLQKLPAILKNGKSDTIYIRGDKNLEYGKIMEIMGVVSSVGTCKVSLIAEKTLDIQASKKLNNKNSSLKKKNDFRKK
jgi:biopolymer transport protein TolR